MTEEKENRPGCKISIAWDREDGVDYINIREQGGELIIKIQKKLWDGVDGVCGFTPEIRDNILEQTRKLYG